MRMRSIWYFELRSVEIIFDVAFSVDHQFPKYLLCRLFWFNLIERYQLLQLVLSRCFHLFQKQQSKCLHILIVLALLNDRPDKPCPPILEPLMLDHLMNQFHHNKGQSLLLNRFLFLQIDSLHLHNEQTNKAEHINRIKHTISTSQRESGDT